MPDRRKVLIIDDEIDLCLLLKGYFLRKNYDVYLSHTLGEGVAFLKSIKPDILFLDNNLPDGIGWSVAPELALEFPSMYINLISAFHPVQPQMPISANFGVIEKPISLNDLDTQLAEIEKEVS
jgi:DNA-binding response OmpR family regulator